MGRGQAIGQVNLEDDGAAMAARAMVTLDERVTDLLEHDWASIDLERCLSGATASTIDRQQTEAYERCRTCNQ